MAMDLKLEEDHGVRLAIEGCGHGTLHAIYASVEEACKCKGWPGVDLLIIGGDFQSVRNAYDLNCVSMPAKYRSMCGFHEYYSGQRMAPYLTMFVGGNHEASNYLFELYYGGWVAPNIYYMGAANVLRLGPLRIAGMSGIWKGYNYRKPHHERLPYNESDIRSIYHTREVDVRKLLQLRSQIDIGISHDWPKGVEWKGNFKQLFNYKKHLEDDARGGALGSVAAKEVMDWLRPRYWFSAHLHCKYAAIVHHEPGEATQQSLPVLGGDELQDRNGAELDLAGDLEEDLPAKNDDEIELDVDDEPAQVDVPAPSHGNENRDAKGANGVNADEIDLELEDDMNGSAAVAPGQGLDGVRMPLEPDAAPAGPILSAEAARAALPESFRHPAARAKQPLDLPPGITNKTTHFLALDKCLPNNHFLQLMSVSSDEGTQVQRPLKLYYDHEWLAITRAFALSEPLVLGDPESRAPMAKSPAEYQKLIDEHSSWLHKHLGPEVAVPDNFAVTAPIYDGGNWNLPQYASVEEHPNPQTAKICEMLQIPNAFEISHEDRAARMAAGPRPDPDAERFGPGGSHRGRGRGRGRGGSRGGGGGRGGGRGRGRTRGR